MEGILIYNDSLSRPDLVLPDGSLVGGLHCGDRIELQIDGQWHAARLELEDAWVMILDGVPTAPPYGKTVRA